MSRKASRRLRTYICMYLSKQFYILSYYTHPSITRTQYNPQSPPPSFRKYVLSPMYRPGIGSSKKEKGIS